MTESARALDKLHQQNEAYVNGTTSTMGGMESKVISNYLSYRAITFVSILPVRSDYIKLNFYHFLNPDLVYYIVEYECSKTINCLY